MTWHECICSAYGWWWMTWRHISEILRFAHRIRRRWMFLCTFWKKGTDSRPFKNQACVTRCLSWEQIEHHSPVRSCSKPVPILRWFHCVKRALGECYKSLGHASSVFIVTCAHTHTCTIDSAPRQIHFSLMDSLLLNGPILHCLLWVTRCVFEMCWDLRSMAFYRYTSHALGWSVFMCACVISIILTKRIIKMLIRWQNTLQCFSSLEMRWERLYHLLSITNANDFFCFGSS